MLKHEILDLDTVTTFTVGQMIRNVLSKTLPWVATAALLYPGIRKVFSSSWRDQLGATYRLGDRDFGPEFFLVVGLVELTMIVFILWPKTRVPAGLAMAGFFVGALIFNLGLRIDSDSIANDQPTLSTLIPLDISHLVLGLAIAALWRTAGQPHHLWVKADVDR